MLNDTLANCLSKIKNAESIGKKKCIIHPNSKLIRGVFNVLKQNGYIKNFTVLDNRKGGFLEVELTGLINNCGVIKPRFSVQKKTYEKFEKRFLPAKDFGIIIISTNKGLMKHNLAKSKGIGGRLIAFCY